MKAKTFQQLTATEVYEILKARCDVFTVEQRICYPDMDDIDYDAVHVFCEDGRGVVQEVMGAWSPRSSSRPTSPMSPW